MALDGAGIDLSSAIVVVVVVVGDDGTDTGLLVELVVTVAFLSLSVPIATWLAFSLASVAVRHVAVGMSELARLIVGRRIEVGERDDQRNHPHRWQCRYKRRTSNMEQ